MGANLKSFEENILKINGSLSNFAYSLICNKDDAEDLVQDTIVKLLGSAEKYTEQGNFKGWAFTVMRNIFINNYRKMSNYKTVDNEVLPLENLAVYNTSTPDSLINAKEINKIIDSFPAELSKPFKMYIAGYAYQEIADKMNIPLGTVKSRIFSARTKLKGMIDRDE